MSADSPNRQRSQSTRINTDHEAVLPQLVTDPTILDSVAGFISDVVPNAYNSTCDAKDQIQWAHFEQFDGDDFIPYSDEVIPSPLILVLGYTSGVQVWSVLGNGEGIELFSWRQSFVKVLRLLPTPYVVNGNISDIYASKRPLIALCDNTAHGPQHCSLNFISLRTGEQVKTIKFKNPVLDVLANRRSVVVTFSEKIAVFDSFTLEDRLSVTTCYLSPGLYPNPVALGTRWMAFAENKLVNAKRTSGGSEGEGVQSYTASVIHAAKSFGRGLREFGETVASSITGNSHHKSVMTSGPHSGSDVPQKGVVTVLDIENPPTGAGGGILETEVNICHFAAHTEAIVCMSFDPSGVLLLTADKRGHDFHLFRIHPHPGGSSFAAVHHLYILHRGDTSARVQDMCFSSDSRWVTVSTLRGTTHVFPVTPYGGPVGFRTHTTPYVVNRMSRFHRSAGLTTEGRSNSPVTLMDSPTNYNLPYHNPRLPPYPHSTVVLPLAQIRQPVYLQNCTNAQQRSHSGRQRLMSSSEDNIQVVLRVCSRFAPPRAWIDNQTPPRDANINKPQKRPVESLFIMSCQGSLIQYNLDPHPVSTVPRERYCDDTPIELSVRAKAQWVLQRQSTGRDLMLPVMSEYLSYICHETAMVENGKSDDNDNKWLSQVEIITHAGPHRRLWMGPQFTFKTHNTNTGVPVNILETKPLDVGRSKPVNMPVSGTYPVVIEAGSLSSLEPSPKFYDGHRQTLDEVTGAVELQLCEDLADAMLESPGNKEPGGCCVIVTMRQHLTGVAKVVNPLGTVVTVHSDDDSIEDKSVDDVVIHENCDEALFRPVVPKKTMVFEKIISEPLPSNRSFPPVSQRATSCGAESDEDCGDGVIGPLHVAICKDKINVENVPNDNEIFMKCGKSMLQKLSAPKSKIKHEIEKLTHKACSDFEVCSKQNKVSQQLNLMKTKITSKKLNTCVKDNDKNEPFHKTPSTKFNLEPTNDIQKGSDNYDGDETFQVAFEKCNYYNKDSLQHKPACCISSEHISKADSKRLLFEDKNNGEKPFLEKPAVTMSTVNIIDHFDDFSSDVPDVKLDDVHHLKRESKRLQEDNCANRTKLQHDTLRYDKYQGLDARDIVSSSEENVVEQMPKKQRKPKTKLGVRIISNVPKEKDDSSSTDVEPFAPLVSLELKEVPEKTTYHDENIKLGSTHMDVDLRKSDFDVFLDKDEVFDDVVKTDRADFKSGILQPVKATATQLKKVEPNLLKVEKSSDEEKLENNSSQTETTESDDSSKIHVEFTAMDTEEDSCQTESKVSTDVSKPSKKKSKKKRR